jgi:hypothetical protein
MSEPRYHLILVHFPDLLDPADFHQIADFVRAKAPDIEPFVISDHMVDVDLEMERRALSKPFLLFSPVSLKRFRPSGGKIYAGNGIPKLEQMVKMKRAGIPVPKWTVIKPNTKLSAAEWGPLVIVKPSIGSLSIGVELRITEEVRYRLPMSYPPNHPARLGPMMAQKFIDSGQAARIRVLTLFGEPLYAEEVKDIEETQWPEVLNAETVSQVVATPVKAKTRLRSFVYDEDVLGLARRASRVYPEMPLQGCDIMREASTGKLFVLELNPGGNTWHFSSRVGRKELVDGRKRDEQFNAFELAADLLIERTRKEAR